MDGMSNIASDRDACSRMRRVLIADDHEILVDMLKRLLEPEFAVVATAGEGFGLVEQATRLRPDIVVVDINMPRCSGIAAGRQIRAIDPAVRLVFLTMQDDPIIAAEAFSIGAVGYVLKTAPADEFLRALRHIAAGGRYLAPEILDGDIDALTALRQDNPLAQISAREKEVLSLLVSGLPMKSVARRLGITARTVAFHKYKVMETLRLKDNAELLEFALRYGLIGSEHATGSRS